VLQERLKALEERLSQHERTQSREADLDSKSVERTRGEMERRLAEMNELRSQINSERSLYVTRDMLDARLQAALTRIESLERDKANIQGRFYAAGVALSVLVILINWVLRVSGH
jgi:chromosome segregation ATPase